MCDRFEPCFVLGYAWVDEEGFLPEWGLHGTDSAVGPEMAWDLDFTEEGGGRAYEGLAAGGVENGSTGLAIHFGKASARCALVRCLLMKKAMFDQDLNGHNIMSGYICGSRH